MNKFDWHSEPAFARPASTNPNNGEVYFENRGISAWDYFAAAALQGLIAADAEYNYLDAATDAARHADAMMLERAKCAAEAHAEWQATLKPPSLEVSGE